MKRPLVSVIIPVYNGARFIREAIESVYRQNYESLEIIIVDDGSTDDTSIIVQSYKDVRYIRQDNLGCAAARNTAIAESGGELLAFLDADDLWADNKLNIQVGCLLKYPQVGYTLGKQRNFLEPGTEKPSWLRKELLQEEHTGFLPTLVIHRRRFDAVGLFNTNFRISSDVEWFSRVADAGISRIVVPEVVLYRRIHNANLGYENLNYETQAGNPLLLKALRASVHRKQMKNSKS